MFLYLRAFLYFVCILVSYNMILFGQDFQEPGYSFVGVFGGEGSDLGQLQDPRGISADLLGNIYIADAGNHRIQMFSSRGEFIMYRGGFGWTDEQFNQPVDIYAKSGLDIYVSDELNNRILRFDKDLNFISAISADDIPEEKWSFGFPRGLVLSPQGDFFFIDGENRRALKMNVSGELEFEFGGFQSLSYRLEEPCQIVVTNGNKIWISDPGLEKILIFDYFGNFLYTLANPSMIMPMGMDVNEKNEVFVADPEKQCILFFSESGKLVDYIDGKTKGIGEPFQRPVDVVCASNMLYVLDNQTCQVYIYKKIK